MTVCLFTKKNKEWQEEKSRRLKVLVESGELRPWRMSNGVIAYGSYGSANQVVAQRMRREREKEERKILNVLFDGDVKTGSGKISNIFVGDRKAWEKDKDRILKPVVEIRYQPCKATTLRVYKVDEGID